MDDQLKNRVAELNRANDENRDGRLDAADLKAQLNRIEAQLELQDQQNRGIIAVSYTHLKNISAAPSHIVNAMYAGAARFMCSVRGGWRAHIECAPTTKRGTQIGRAHV